MGVFTFITAEQLADFLTGYDLGQLEKFEGIQQGVSNTNYHVWTNKGRYILTLFESRTDSADLPFFFAFSEHLFEREIACPRAYADQQGNIFNTLAGKSASLINFLPGRDVKNANLTPDHCQRMGTLLGRMHNAAMDFSWQRPNALSVTGWQTIAQNFLLRADEVRPGLSALLADTLMSLSADWPTDDLPRATVHADLEIDNLLFTESGPPGVIDFYFSCTDFLAYDLALTVNSWCFDEHNKFVSARFTALMEGYQTERPH